MLDNVETEMELNNNKKETTFKVHFQLSWLMKATLNKKNSKIVHHAYK